MFPTKRGPLCGRRLCFVLNFSYGSSAYRALDYNGRRKKSRKHHAVGGSISVDFRIQKKILQNRCYQKNVIRIHCVFVDECNKSVQLQIFLLYIYFFSFFFL